MGGNGEPGGVSVSRVSVSPIYRFEIEKSFIRFPSFVYFPRIRILNFLCDLLGKKLEEEVCLMFWDWN